VLVAVTNNERTKLRGKKGIDVAFRMRISYNCSTTVNYIHLKTNKENIRSGTM